MKKFLLSLGLLVFWTPIVFAQSKTVKAESGKPVQALRIYSEGPDCKSLSIGKPYITEEPKHGKAYLQSQNVAVDHQRCGKITVQATDIYYRSKAGYKGSDSFDLSLVREADQTSSGGRETQIFRFPVEVR